MPYQNVPALIVRLIEERQTPSRDRLAYRAIRQAMDSEASWHRSGVDDGRDRMPVDDGRDRMAQDDPLAE